MGTDPFFALLKIGGSPMNKTVMLGKGRSLCPISHSEFTEDVAFYCF